MKKIIKIRFAFDLCRQSSTKLANLCKWYCFRHKRLKMTFLFKIWYENKLNRRGPNQSKVLMNLTLDNQTFKILVKNIFSFRRWIFILILEIWLPCTQSTSSTSCRQPSRILSHLVAHTTRLVPYLSAQVNCPDPLASKVPSLLFMQ